ncbi:unnamed protein product [Penicillium crustosum]
MGDLETFDGYMISSHVSWSDFQKQEFKPKSLGERDVEIALEACGVCGSDIHTLTGSWEQAKLPVSVGHERSWARLLGSVLSPPKLTPVKMATRRLWRRCITGRPDMVAHR